MDITLSEHHATLAKKHAAAAGYDDVGEYIVHLIELESAAEADRAEVIAAVRESSADIAAGRVRPLKEALADIAKKHGFTPLE